MKSKILTKTVKQRTLFSVIIAVILAAAVAIGVWFGISAKHSIFNTSITMEPQKTLTVTLNQYAYNSKLETIEADCEKLLANYDVAYDMKGQMSGDESEIVFVFKSDANLSVVKGAMQTYFDTATADSNNVYYGLDITVASNSEFVAANMAKDYIVRGAIASAVFIVLAFAYMAWRYKVGVSLLVTLCNVLGVLLTTAIVILARIPVTVSVSYVMAVSAMLTTVVTLMTMSKLRLNAKSESEAEKSAEEQVVSAIAVKEICAMTALGGVSLVLVGAIATSAVRWFAVVALIALLVSAFIGLFYAPALYLPMKEAADKKPAKKDYQGAKKTSKKEKKVYAPAKKEAVAAAPVAAPVEEAEEVAEEAPVEETEEVVEEAPVEEVTETEEAKEE